MKAKVESEFIFKCILFIITIYLLPLVLNVHVIGLYLYVLFIILEIQYGTESIALV